MGLLTIANLQKRHAAHAKRIYTLKVKLWKRDLLISELRKQIASLKSQLKSR